MTYYSALEVRICSFKVVFHLFFFFLGGVGDALNIIKLQLGGVYLLQIALSFQFKSLAECQVIYRIKLKVFISFSTGDRCSMWIILYLIHICLYHWWSCRSISSKLIFMGHDSIFSYISSLLFEVLFPLIMWQTWYYKSPEIFKILCFMLKKRLIVYF